MDDAQEETGTVGNGLKKKNKKKKMQASFYSVELRIQTLCLASTRKRDWKPKGSCCLCVETWLTIINDITGG